MINCHCTSKTHIQNKSVNPYNAGGGKLFFIPHINTADFGTKSLRYNGPLTWMSVSESIDSNDFFNVEISKLKKFLKDFLLKIIVNIFV